MRRLRTKLSTRPLSVLTSSTVRKFHCAVVQSRLVKDKTEEALRVMSDPENSLAGLQAAAFRHVDRVVGEGGYQLEYLFPVASRSCVAKPRNTAAS